jgi:hypothetical protein
MVGGYPKMADKLPFTIEILDFGDEPPLVLDQVIGGSAYLEEAKRIGQHLLSIVDAGTRPHGYRIFSKDRELVYTWRPEGFDENSPQTDANKDPAARSNGHGIA